MLNPNAMVPVIRDGDFVLWESNSIIRYLANHYGGDALYPAQPQLRAHVDQWMDWQASELNRSWSHALHGLMRKNPAYQDAAQIAASAEAWGKKMRILERQLRTTAAYVAGEAFTLADIPIGLSVQRWFSTPLPHPELPAIAAYYDRLAKCRGYREYGRNGIP